MSQPSIIDSKLFDPAAIDSETADFVKHIEKELSTAPPLYKFEPQAIREARAAGYSVFGAIKHLDGAQDRKVPGPAGDIPIRVFIPEKVAASNSYKLPSRPLEITLSRHVVLEPIWAVPMITITLDS